MATLNQHSLGAHSMTRLGQMINRLHELLGVSLKLE